MPTPENSLFIQIQQQALDQSVAMSGHSLDAIGRFNQLHLQTIKVSLEEAGERLAELVTAGSGLAAADVLSRWFSPGGARLESWMGHFRTITSETGTELAKDMERQIVGNGSSLRSALEATVLNDPAGTQGMFPWMQPAESSVIDPNSPGHHGNEPKAASRRARSIGAKQVRRGTARKKASPINL